MKNKKYLIYGLMVLVVTGCFGAYYLHVRGYEESVKNAKAYSDKVKELTEENK